MAHEIDFSTGKAAIAYRGEKPWHGYGQEIPHDIPLYRWRELAGLDWSVQRRPIFTNLHLDQEDAGAGFGATRIPNRVALTRSDNNDVLSVVSDRYKPVQPKEVIEFFADLIEHNGFQMNTAGALRGGKRVWALADVGKELEIAGDKVGGYLLLATAYDGTFATTAQFTSIRVVCNNTLGFSLNRGGEGGIVKIPHTTHFNATDVKVDLGLNDSWAKFRDNVVLLSEHKVTKREAIDFFLTVMGVTEEEAADGKQLANVKKLLSFYESGPGSDLKTADSTLWGAVNAVTFFADHARRAKDEGARFDSASFGTGSKLKQKALNHAIEIAEAA